MKHTIAVTLALALFMSVVSLTTMAGRASNNQQHEAISAGYHVPAASASMPAVRGVSNMDNTDDIVYGTSTTKASASMPAVRGASNRDNTDSLI